MIVKQVRQPSHENALSAPLTTLIIPVRAGLAMMVTNSMAGVKCDTWLMFERHMATDGENVSTVMVFVDSRIHVSDAVNAAYDYAHVIFGVTFDPLDLPF